MPNLPSQFLNSLKSLDLPDLNGFIQVHESPEQITSIRCNPFKTFHPEFDLKTKIPWVSEGYYLSSRPSFTHDPAFHAGCYYVQEAGSMFLEYALFNHVDLSKDLKVLDLCGAPGGKSTLLNSLISEQSLLVSNEMIQNRSQILAYNLSKWGRANTLVTNNAPEQFEKLPSFFDLIVVDAPCSGSGLFRKQEGAIGEWSPEHVVSCSLRQKNILKSALQSLKENGHLFYSTCSYSAEENESIVDWLIQEQEMELVNLEPNPTWGIVKSDKGLRFYPHLLKSEGFFCSLLVKKTGGKVKNSAPTPSKVSMSEKEKKILEEFVKSEGLHLLKKNEKFYLLNQLCRDFLQHPVRGFYFRKAGVCLGELKNMELVPDQEFALSLYLSENVRKVDLTKDAAIAYLKKESFLRKEDQKGLVCFTYQKNGIGWGKMLPNRINNYLPPHLRILK